MLIEDILPVENAHRWGCVHQAVALDELMPGRLR